MIFSVSQNGFSQEPRHIKHTPDSDTFHVMTLLRNNPDIAFLCHKQNLTTVLLAGVCLCTAVNLSIWCTNVWKGRKNRGRMAEGHGRENSYSQWQSK